jgi:ABC-type bacteriocin/lantibiotic exporter with double-glycine peptidase domain
MKMDSKRNNQQQGNASTIALMTRYMKGSMGIVVVISILYFIDMFSYLIPPFIQQVFTDNIITNKNPEWFTPLIIIYILLFVLELTVWLFMNVRRRREFSRMNLLASARYVSSLLRLPMSIIDRFSAGELVARYASILKTTKVIDMFFASMILCVRPLICSWLLMMYNWKLGLVVVVSMLMLATVMLRTAEKLKQKAKSTEVTDARLQGVTMTGLKNMETIKSMGGEWVFYEQWEHAFANALNARVRSTMSMMGVGAIPLMVLHMCNALLLCLGAWYILQGELTPGMLLASQALASSIIYPINNTVKSAQRLFQSHAAMERLEEVNNTAKEYADMVIPDESDLPERTKLRGEIELRNVTFGYDRSLPPILNHFSLKINAGESVAFVGFSGCGKSTITKLISGLYEPWEGEILLDGVPLKQVNRALLINSLSVVNQDITLFEGTIADNIKMWDESIEDFSMVMAANDAQIHKDIAERPGAYNSMLNENGKNFSGGQRQRIEIATALAKDPTILVLDEATSALDPKTEEQVMKHINNMGITLVMVAHRLSTIRDCDQIYVMENGQIQQHGTHSELMQQQGLYSKLMKYA